MTRLITFLGIKVHHDDLSQKSPEIIQSTAFAISRHSLSSQRGSKSHIRAGNDDLFFYLYIARNEWIRCELNFASMTVVVAAHLALLRPLRFAQDRQMVRLARNARDHLFHSLSVHRSRGPGAVFRSVTYKVSDVCSLG